MLCSCSQVCNIRHCWDNELGQLTIATTNVCMTCCVLYFMWNERAWWMSNVEASYKANENVIIATNHCASYFFVDILCLMCLLLRPICFLFSLAIHCEIIQTVASVSVHSLWETLNIFLQHLLWPTIFISMQKSSEFSNAAEGKWMFVPNSL